MNICLIGCGKMGSALLAGWQQDNQLEASFIAVDPAINATEKTFNNVSASIIRT